MKQPDELGRAAELLYGDAEDVKSKLSNPPEKHNLFERPSLIPGVEYPTTDREERLLTLAWNHAVKLSAFHWFDKSEDAFLNYMRKEVERIRREDLGYE